MLLFSNKMNRQRKFNSKPASKDSVPIPRYGRMINIGFRRVQLRMLASPGPISATKWCERSNPICLLNGCTMCSSWTVDRISKSALKQKLPANTIDGKISRPI
ncbi:hypothetical protein X801_04981 [Opisthorchis viverrini]|uniref:Uncharacterized protein n=1 Tax=Opisthorchis viverrini TaxID=6198 RepID=A0A1S8WXN2_OPIVI|nr:hypothetical protein X801_04981 [Opisthorchis viverrini]